MFCWLCWADGARCGAYRLVVWSLCILIRLLTVWAGNVLTLACRRIIYICGGCKIWIWGSCHWAGRGGNMSLCGSAVCSLSFYSYDTFKCIREERNRKLEHKLTKRWAQNMEIILQIVLHDSTWRRRYENWWQIINRIFRKAYCNYKKSRESRVIPQRILTDMCVWPLLII